MRGRFLLFRPSPCRHSAAFRRKRLCGVALRLNRIARIGGRLIGPSGREPRASGDGPSYRRIAPRKEPHEHAVHPIRLGNASQRELLAERAVAHQGVDQNRAGIFRLPRSQRDRRRGGSAVALEDQIARLRGEQRQFGRGKVVGRYSFQMFVAVESYLIGAGRPHGDQSPGIARRRENGAAASRRPPAAGPTQQSAGGRRSPTARAVAVRGRPTTRTASRPRPPLCGSTDQSATPPGGTDSIESTIQPGARSASIANRASPAMRNRAATRAVACWPSNSIEGAGEHIHPCRAARKQYFDRRVAIERLELHRLAGSRRR